MTARAKAPNEMHLYGAEWGWIAGGPVAEGVDRATAAIRVAAAVRNGFRGTCRGETSKPLTYRWNGSEHTLPEVGPDVAVDLVFVGDARDRHLMGEK